MQSLNNLVSGFVNFAQDAAFNAFAMILHDKTTDLAQQLMSIQTDVYGRDYRLKEMPKPGLFGKKCTIEGRIVGDSINNAPRVLYAIVFRKNGYNRLNLDIVGFEKKSRVMDEGVIGAIVIKPVFGDPTNDVLMFSPNVLVKLERLPIKKIVVAHNIKDPELISLLDKSVEIANNYFTLVNGSFSEKVKGVFAKLFYS